MMASDGMLSLSWNNHKATFCHILSTLREKERYTDVTLACEGKFYPVHKLVLSTCSEYFEKMFEHTPCKHPVVVLKDIKCSDIEALLSYMYDGVVSVLQQDLARLIKAAELLQIKGLAVPDEPPMKEQPTKKNAYPWSSRDDRSSPHPKRRRREEMMTSTPQGSSLPPPDSPPTSPQHHQESNQSWDPSKAHSQDQREDEVEQRLGEHVEPAVEFSSPKQEASHNQEQVDESLVKEEVIEGSEDNQGEGMDSRIEYGGMGGGDSSAGGDEQGGKYSHQLDTKHGAQPLHEAVVEALAGPSGMQGWLGTGELGGGFSMLEGYSEDGGQEAHQTSGPHSTQQSHQMVEAYTDGSRSSGRGAGSKVELEEGGARFSPGAASSRVHQCNFCTYSTARKDHLQVHIRTHTGEKPFSCAHCDYRASTKRAVKEHMRVHTGEKPFACQFCPYRASYSFALRYHLQKHKNHV
ncbi:broad-complex core protein isoforms 1/2/3/4/5-like isoform X9 [Eriocheir sinensis]|uniref:broad-complex core protein isoforms 1/2/3/4/5-like isoform X9 n=1 Tax=Eriocheir sinensis TaxID=95602 RepID=UPI0021C5784C|nr:broad-complex core protein isoforms 1/2/3/4/5-like isoform X9 [Eriocheir sinensis]